MYLKGLLQVKKQKMAVMGEPNQAHAKSANKKGAIGAFFVEEVIITSCQAYRNAC